eukprot:579519-Amphidinium_carterae.1
MKHSKSLPTCLDWIQSVRGSPKPAAKEFENERCETMLYMGTLLQCWVLEVGRIALVSEETKCVVANSLQD